MIGPRVVRMLSVIGAGIALSGARAADPIPRPPAFDYTMNTLQNGLQAVFLEDHSTPLVHLAIWYHVGSKDERPGAPASRICSST